ncbi:MAG: hypothetical protein KDI51_15285 [Xanthomonadales bacterium]|nr:hypothetical protein [Xanthomonadales bacterium]
MFALATDEHVLYVFPTETEAIDYCEGPDVESGAWQFFDHAGTPLEAVFSEPVKRSALFVTQGRYALRPAPGVSLIARLADIWAIEGFGVVQSMDDVHRLLTSH